MPEYQTPGVYVEEVERGAKSIEGVGTSTAGFLGRTERGPTDPQFVTSYAEFKRVFGEPFDNSNLAYAVDGFFNNGGSNAYVGRIVPEKWTSDTSATASVTLDDGNSTDTHDIDAVGPGPWGADVAVNVDDASLGDDAFKLRIGYWEDLPETTDRAYSNEAETDADKGLVQFYGEPVVEEVYDNLSTNERSSNFVENRLGGSNLVDATQESATRPANTTTILSASRDFAIDENANATDDENQVDRADFQGITTAGERTGLQAFQEIDEIAMVCVPDENRYDGLRGDIITHCQTEMGDRVAILQPGSGTQPVKAKEAAGKVDTSYAAFYYPWVTILDPATGIEKAVPPCGHVAGIYARSDNQHGVHKAPANEVVRGIQSLELNLTKADQSQLNPQGVNCIRSLRGRGIRVWGARTLSSNPSWKYLNVRRLMLYIEESIDEGTQWVVFESNDERTWARVRQTVRNFLTSVWDDGALMGSTPEEAFYVKCDRSTMTQDDIDNGRLICEIGVAPVKPAEFVIFRISQWTGGVEGE
ncbi:phage tail sheath family protein [Haloarcula sp. CBA1130]|uniref:phage tail sheath family protein n=1 Tax=unclassified Haloarcula TaxID=2624677 RepID=UPI001243BF2D|nr:MULTISPECIES: phage tail sheath family protein [unclassified Haloarcula]KAA9396520.1 phage tail sheath family protein [Haloarcula sp. CBA1130]KAA9397623.1 phage tail sheath family protein [Haloarcula sp. CBA1129]